MSKFKYSINARFTNIESRNSFMKELITLGYELKSASFRGDVIIINGTKSLCGNAEFKLVINPLKRDFTFNIDNKWEYEAALAIAAIRDDDKSYVGEWVRLFKVTWSGYKDKHDVLHKINVLGGEDRYSYEGSSNQDGFETNLNGGYSRKATPEEIISYMKEQYRVPDLPEKWAISTPSVANKKDFQEYFEGLYSGNPLCWGFTTGFFHYPRNSEGAIYNSGRVYSGYEEITYEQWKKWYDYQNTNMKQYKEIIGYKLIKEFPGSPKLNTVQEPIISGTINIHGTHLQADFPEFWEPVYKKEEVIITVKGKTTFDVIITTNNDIKVGKNESIHIDRLRDIHKYFVPTMINGWSCEVNRVDIGCRKNIPFKYLKEIIDAWEKLNK